MTKPSRQRSRPWAPPIVAVVMVVCCGGPSVERPVTQQTLPDGVLARIEGHDISVSLVTRIAQAQHVSLLSARDRALADARLAVEARRSLPLQRQGALERAVFSRTLLESLQLEARGQGPIADAELQSLTDKRWIDLARPPSVRTTHAVALKSAGGSADAARAVAVRIREATRAIREPGAFQSAARAVATGAVEVRAERLPFITPDGRGISVTTPREPTQVFDKTFATAANELRDVGDQSDIVETRFGFHVILLEERLAERRVPENDRKEALQAEAMRARALSLRTALVEKLAETTPISVSRDVDRATAALLR